MLSRRVRGALEKALQSGVGSAAAQQRDRNDKLGGPAGDLEAIVEEQGKEMRAGRRAAEDAITEMREEQAQALRRLERALAELTRRAGTRMRRRQARRGPARRQRGWQLRREYPGLVTPEPAGDDEDVSARPGPWFRSGGG